MKFGQLILRKITKTVATRCQILRPKCTKINFGWSLPETPLGELAALPRHTNWNKGDLMTYTSKGRGGCRGSKGRRKGKAREG